MIFKENDKKRREFGDFLKSKRLLINYSVRQVANIVNVPFGVYASIERGEKAKIRMTMLEGLANLYNVNIDDICLRCERIPSGIFYKLIRCPALLEVIRNYPE